LRNEETIMDGLGILAALLIIFVNVTRDHES